MDVKNYLESGNILQNSKIELTGWLVDTNDGLFLLGDHYPENYNFEFRIKIENSNIIYKILEKIPTLAGGWSSLFYKAKVIGFINDTKEIKADEIFVQSDRLLTELEPIDISDKSVLELVEKYGDYEFNRPRNPMRDWLEDFGSA